MVKKYYKSKSNQLKQKTGSSSVKKKSSSKSEKKLSILRRKKLKKLSEINIIKFAQDDQAKQKDTSIKKKLKALKFFNIKPDKTAENMNINELKEFADKFDLNPIINYKLLNKLGKNNSDYKKYINKYKYTLDFQNALSLECFDKQYIVEMMNEYNNNISKYKIKIKKIKFINEIKSFSKIKIFNLLFFLNSNESSNISFLALENKILSYTIPVSLVFKVPNKFGNIELQYYSYLLFLINILIPQKTENNNKKKNKGTNSSLNQEIFFDFGTKKEKIEQEIDITDFTERKKLLDEYLKGIETKETIIEEIKPLTEQAIKNNIENKKGKLRIFFDNIREIICLDDDKEILNIIKFIYYAIIFYEGDDQNLVLLSSSLKINNYSKKEIQQKEYCFNQKLKKNYKKIIIKKLYFLILITNLTLFIIIHLNILHFTIHFLIF